MIYSLLQFFIKLDWNVVFLLFKQKSYPLVLNRAYNLEYVGRNAHIWNHSKRCIKDSLRVFFSVSSTLVIWVNRTNRHEETRPNVAVTACWWDICQYIRPAKWDISEFYPPLRLQISWPVSLEAFRDAEHITRLINTPTHASVRTQLQWWEIANLHARWITTAIQLVRQPYACVNFLWWCNGRFDKH